MDPTHFLSNQSFKHNTKTSLAEIEAFYAFHGSDWLAAVSRWRVRMNTAWLRIRSHQNHMVGFAEEAHGD